MDAVAAMGKVRGGGGRARSWRGVTAADWLGKLDKDKGFILFAWWGVKSVMIKSEWEDLLRRTKNIETAFGIHECLVSTAWKSFSHTPRFPLRKQREQGVRWWGLSNHIFLLTFFFLVQLWIILWTLKWIIFMETDWELIIPSSSSPSMLVNIFILESKGSRTIH